jgi:hypothetical protein
MQMEQLDEEKNSNNNDSMDNTRYDPTSLDQVGSMVSQMDKNTIIIEGANGLFTHVPVSDSNITLQEGSYYVQIVSKSDADGTVVDEHGNQINQVSVLFS